ncbi:MAG: hypothetical protein R2745_08480 [Vicinamibacterales bacterium]
MVLDSLLRRRALLAAVAVLVAAAATPAAAQIGDPIPSLITTVTGGSFNIEVDCDNDDTAQDLSNTFGMTLLGALAPGGPVLGSLFAPPIPGGCQVIAAAPPPGTYYVLIVYGQTSSFNASPSDWIRIDIAPACVGRPNPPTLTAAINGQHVTLTTTGSGGCAYDYVELEAGTTPGSKDLGTFPLSSSVFNATVPPGNYYVRARAVNPYGKSAPSDEVPISSPGCTGVPQAPVTWNAAVNGNNVTISWTQTPGVPGPPISFYQIDIHDVTLPNYQPVVNRVVLPGTVTSVSAPVPSGPYKLLLRSGNQCVLSPLANGRLLTFTVP